MDANADNRTRTPVENIYFNSPMSGPYNLRVHLFASRTGGRPEPFQLQIREGGQVQVLNGVVSPGRGNWSTSFTAGGN